MPENFEAEGADTEAIADLRAWLITQEGEVSSAAVIQCFQGTVHEALLAAEQSEIMQWGEEFDVTAEFHDVLAKLREESRRKKFHELNLKMAGKDLKTISEQERELYLQLSKPG